MGVAKNEIRSVSGGDIGPVQSFYSNKFVDYKGYGSNIDAWEIPQYNTIGGVDTNVYYQQNSYAIFTNMSRPFIRFTFTGNTDSFGETTDIVHDIYKIDFETFNGYRSDLTKDGFDSVKNQQSTIDEKTTSIDEDGVKRVTSKKIESSLTDSVKDLIDDKTTTFEQLQEKLNDPIISLTASTSGITTSVYDLVLDEEYKNIGDFSDMLFEDRSQYFINTTFKFKNTRELYESYSSFNNGYITDVDLSSTFYLETENERHEISGGTYSGLTVLGNYFTYFIVPDKPELTYPITEGTLTTFTPEFFWTNGESADAYIFQIVYDTTDTGFTSTVYSYPVDKSEETLEESIAKKNYKDSSFSSSKKTRKFQLPLKSNKCFRYRVGNVKEIEDLFGIKRSIFTFSDSYTACTASETVKTFVRTRSDSPYLADVPLLDVPPSLEAESPLEEFTLSGVVTGSVISYAEVQLHNPNGSFVTKQTDAVGYFEFDELEAGNYSLITRYRGYQDETTPLTISSDNYITVKLKLLWGNDDDTWGDKADDIPFI